MRSNTELLLFLRQESYRESGEVIQSGDFRVLGDTIEWWPVNTLEKWRFTFFGEDIETTEVKNEGGWKKAKYEQEFLPNQINTKNGTIRPGEYIVHPNHGVGIFEYLTTKVNLDKEIRTYISLIYAGNDRLLFPKDRYEELMPYIGSRHPRLTRLYSKSWEHTKEKVQRNLIVIARELLKIYAARHIAKREPIPACSAWQKILAESVDFRLTEDQAKALREINEDLSERNYPMDRLVCGDVGFGKTEVALRAAAQVIAAGKQVAFVAPTTVLVEQHYALLEQRFADLPVKIAHLSRLTGGQDKTIIEDIKEGKTDLVVGTHRLLSKDIEFKNLGMLVLDEEQKFGVAQKEQLKKIRPCIDVLSLSATPIPRTLSLSLSGLRGLSILSTAPPGRLPIQTMVLNYSDEEVKQALAKEINRGGQVYVVHNRVQSLQAVRERIIKLVGETGLENLRIEMAHGQMEEKILAQTMSQFLRGGIDILVASSIVEHGLDSPSANTLVVLHSEWFGLSDLYQLRGRVGRRQKQAYAYFMLGGIERMPYGERTEDSIKITETARKRLVALQEADELGSGWSIALRDLEIRGGGNILGHEQHGYMEAIGLLLYSQLLKETIGKEAMRLGIDLFHPAALA